MSKFTPLTKGRSRLLGGGGVLVGIGLMATLLLSLPAPFVPNQQYGVSFSASHAAGIGLDWQETYQAILHDLGVKHLRLAAEWDAIEPVEDEYNFSVVDYQLDEAQTAGAQVILAIGRKVPRWPECHEPSWVSSFSEQGKQQRVLAMLEVVVRRYQQHPALTMWQLENEPLLAFGDCPPADEEFLTREQALLRALDPAHPILITDSGELNWWLDAARYGDVLGTTMYRTVFSGRTRQLFHYDYLFPAWLYRAKARLVKIIRGKGVLISELQGEPWGKAPFTELSIGQRRASLAPQRLLQLRRFAARTQLPVAYWWGAEYWYWEKVKNNEPAFWEIAKQFFL